MKKAEQAISPGAIFHNGIFEPVDSEQGQPDATEMLRREIADYIKSRLGPQLCAAAAPSHGAMTYAQAVESSVATGCYDHGWLEGDYTRVERYIGALRQTWLESQGDITPIVARLQHVLAFGSDHEKSELKKLLQLP
jgi:hypothetical protein